MKSLLLPILIIISACNVPVQPGHPFIIEKKLLSPVQHLTKDETKRLYRHFYEDEKYKVTTACFGEFGGAVFFKNKKTGVEYFCDATCPVAVLHINGKYIVSSSLAHLSGSTTIVQIDDPEEMTVYNAPADSVMPLSNFFQQKGATVLADTIGLLTLASFVFEDQVYYITTDWDKTNIAKIVNGKFINLALLHHKGLWMREIEMIPTEDHHSIVFFRTDSITGHIDIFENKIVFNEYR